MFKTHFYPHTAIQASCKFSNENHRPFQYYVITNITPWKKFLSGERQSFRCFRDKMFGKSSFAIST